MRVEELMRFGVPPRALTAIAQAEGDHLLPLQEQAVWAGLLDGSQNLLVVAPSSTGKTLIGEIAAVASALGRGRTLFCVPLRSMAEEKFGLFRERYEPLGLRVAIGTRDHPEFNATLRTGRFHLAVVVYEKAAALVARRRFGGRLGLVVIDEAQLIADGERGTTLDTFLTLLLRMRPGPRIVGLSAPTPHAQALAGWLGARLVQTDYRPVELRKGVVCCGTFHYREHNSGQEGVEGLLPPYAGATPSESLLEPALAFLEKGEPTAVFLPTRWQCVETALGLAERSPLRLESSALAPLKQLEDTPTSRALIQCASRGVVFHSADLTLEQRDAVETLIRSRLVLLTCSTPTLSMGVNLPFINVMMTDQKCANAQRRGARTLTDLPYEDFQAQAGRAGRLGCGAPFGRAMILAATPFDRDVLMEHLVARASLPAANLPAPTPSDLLRILAALEPASEEELATAAGSTYAASRTPDLSTRASWRALKNAGLVRESPQGSVLTPLGRAASDCGIDLETTALFVSAVREVGTFLQDECVALAVATASPAFLRNQSAFIPPSTEKEGWRRFQESVEDSPSSVLGFLAPYLAGQEGRVRGAICGILQDWIGGVRGGVLEERYEITVGRIEALAHDCSWLVESLAHVAEGCTASREVSDCLTNLASRVAVGLAAKNLDLAKMMRRGLPRRHALALADAGITYSAIRDSRYLSELSPLVPQSTYEAVRAAAGSAARAPAATKAAGAARTKPPKGAAQLAVAVGEGGRLVEVAGTCVAVSALQGRLLQLLLEADGSPLPYEQIAARLWGDQRKDASRRTRHRVQVLAGRLRATLAKAYSGGQAAHALLTIPGMGLAFRAAALRQD